MLHGPRIRLKRLMPKDVTERYAEWMNDPEVNRYLESRVERHSVESLRTFVASIATSTRSFLFGIYDGTSRHIGNIKLGPIDVLHQRGSIGLLIGEKDVWGSGYASESISIVADFAFEIVHLRKLTAGCYASNISAIKAFQRAGFEIEAVLKKHVVDGESPVDVVLLARFRPGADI